MHVSPLATTGPGTTHLLSRRHSLRALIAVSLILMPGRAHAQGAAPMSERFPVTERRITLNGNLTRVIEAGNPAATQTVILINGGPGSSSDYLHGLLALAGADLHVVTYDQRGTGGTAWPDPEAFTMPTLIADIEALRVALDVERVHLVGHSWGGFLAALYTATQPEHVASLTLIGPMPLAASTDTLDAGIASMERGIRALQDTGAIPDPLPADDGDNCAASGAATYAVFLADPAHAAQTLAQMPVGACSIAAGNELAGNAWMAVATEEYQALREAAQGWTGPLFVIFGDHDDFAPDWREAALAEFPHARLQMETVTRAGHSPWLEDPSLIDRIHDFILTQRTDARSVSSGAL